MGIALSAPEIEGLEADRRPLRISAGVEGAVEVADGVQPEPGTYRWCVRVLDRKLHLPQHEPAPAVRAAEGVHPPVQPFHVEKNSLGRQTIAYVLDPRSRRE
jgi:hypothetical protein